MLKKIKEGIYLSVGLASLVKKEVDKHVNKLVKDGQIKTKSARKIVNKAVAEAQKEGIKLEKVLAAELKKEVKKAVSKAKKI